MSTWTVTLSDTTIDRILSELWTARAAVAQALVETSIHEYIEEYKAELAEIDAAIQELNPPK